MSKSYGRHTWSTLSSFQKDTASRVWRKIFDELRVQVKTAVNANETRDGSHEEDESATRQNWNVDDTARLIHIWADPRYCADVTKTTEPLERHELDDRQRISPWVKLADKFNSTKDYYVYSNPLFSVNGNGEKMPHINKESLFHNCARLNPTNSIRIARDADQIKLKMRGLKTEFSRVYKSGNQELEDLDSEF